MSSDRLRIRTRRVPGVPVVAARVLLFGGARIEEVPGQALMTGRSLAEGSQRRTWEHIADEAEDRGMVLQSFGTFEAIGVAVDALAGDWELALEWLAELALEPSFPEERCDWLTRQAAGEIESFLDQPETVVTRAFLDQVYNPHPYGRFLQGDLDSLPLLNPETCHAHHRRSLDLGCLVTVAGEIDEAAATARVGELFSAIHGASAPIPAPPNPDDRGPQRRELELPGSEQTYLAMGHRTVPRAHDDGAALSLLAVILGAGAGLAGRLPERIRERQGLAYHVDVATAGGAGLDPGRLAIFLGTQPATAEAAERAALEELERLVTDGITDEELDDARSYLLGSDPFRRETARQWADLLAETVFYDLPLDRPEWLAERLRACDRATVEAAARRWIRPQELRVAIGCPD